MNQMQFAFSGQESKEMIEVARKEGLPVEFVLNGIRDGSIVIPKNKFREEINVIGIGKGLKTKINANIGTSPAKSELRTELKKLRTAIEFGADTVMDLSIGGEIDRVRRKIISVSTVPVGTVPIYQAALEAGKKDEIYDLSKDHLMEVIERHAMDGVDFVTIHSGITLDGLEKMKKQGRITGIVSRGGAILASWMIKNKKENPLKENFDELLEIAKKYDLTLSLGDGLRPGCLADATDSAQLEELKTLGEQVLKAREQGVQAMVEGPGHVPLNQIKENMELEKKLCFNAPFYVLGPIVTDIAPGYDHITSAIGGAIAAFYGADFLCYVTPAEHLSLPNEKDVKEGVIASRIAAHAADIAKGIPAARKWDDEMAKARKALDWEKMFGLAIDPIKARKYREKSQPKNKRVCTMCAEMCSMNTMNLVEKRGKTNRNHT